MPGFYDQVLPLTVEDRHEIAQDESISLHTVQPGGPLLCSVTNLRDASGARQRIWAAGLAISRATSAHERPTPAGNPPVIEVQSPMPSKSSNVRRYT